jgi:hypothetical protein
MKFDIGTKFYISFNEDKIHGEVVEPKIVSDYYSPGRKIIMPGDICVRWETTECSTYDREWLLDNNATGVPQ